MHALRDRAYNDVVRHPFSHGKYEVAPGLRKLDLDDDKIFLQSEHHLRRIALKKTYAASRSPVHVVAQHSHDVDSLLIQAAGRWCLEDHSRRWQRGSRFGMQVEEDLAVVKDLGDGRNQVVYLHVSFPNGWDPASKIGLDFAQIHAPVAGFEKMARDQHKIVQSMIHRGPFERHAWGVHQNDSLERLSPCRWQLLKSPADACLRTERQTSWGFPELDMALFTIHTTTLTLNLLDASSRLALGKALFSMNDDHLRYKGMTRHVRDLVGGWCLDAGDAYAQVGEDDV